MTKCNVVPRMESWKRKRTLVENLVKLNKVDLVSSNTPMVRQTLRGNA